MRRVLLLLISLVLIVFLPARELDENGQTSMTFELNIGVRKQTKVGFTESNNGFSWETGKEPTPCNGVSLSLNENREIEQTPSKIYFYWQRYDETGCNFTFSPNHMSIEDEGYEDIKYSVVVKEVNVGESGASTLSSTTVKSGSAITFNYDGGNPEIHLYELTFDIDLEKDIPSRVKTDSYTGGIKISCNVN